MARTFSDEDEERLRQLHADGVSRNEIARQMDWSVATITNHATRLGLSFDRSATRAATEARQVDLTARRQLIQEQLLDVAETALGRTQREYLVTGWTHTGEIVHELLREPPAKETKDLTAAAMSALARFDQKAKDDAGGDDRNLSAIDRFLSAAMGDPAEPDE
ncbi:GcrA family cell cycle regulator [Streptomyces sp. NPDC001073]